MSDSGAEVTSYRDLVAWQEAVELAVECYRVTRAFPREEAYGLTSQIRRAATSIAANIAEGNGRNNAGDYAQFLRIAQGSLKELETHLIIARRVELLPDDLERDLLEHSDRLGRLLRGLLRAIERRRRS